MIPPPQLEAGNAAAATDTLVHHSQLKLSLAEGQQPLSSPDQPALEQPSSHIWTLPKPEGAQLPEAPALRAGDGTKTSATDFTVIQSTMDQLGLKRYDVTEKEAAWTEVSKAVEAFSNELIDQWNREIDGLLTFGGLFSAILTAFNVQSYQLLIPSTSDTTNAILVRVSAQLESFRTGPSFSNSTQPSFNPTTSLPPFHAPLYAIWLNSLWFTSLVFSLSSATLGITVKQWLKEYRTGVYGISCDISRRRQYRYDYLRKWHVDTIVAIIPLLLIIATVLFSAGLLVLLYNINDIVAIVVSVFIGILVVFIAVTTILPTISPTCCYSSPQARGLFKLTNWSLYTIGKLAPPLISGILWVVIGPWHWLAGLLAEPGYGLGTRLKPVENSWCHRIGVWRDKIPRQVAQLATEPRVWLRGERKLSSAQELDVNIMVTAYSTTLDAALIDTSSICITDSSDDSALVHYLPKLKHVLRRQYGAKQQLWPTFIKERLQIAAFQSMGFAWEGGPSASRGIRSSEDAECVSPTATTMDIIKPAFRSDTYAKIELQLNELPPNKRSGDEYIRLQVSLSMCCEFDPEAADTSWELILRVLRLQVRDSPSWQLNTYKQVAAVGVYRMRAFLRGLGPRPESPNCQRNVSWELEHTIYKQLRAFTLLLDNLILAPTSANTEAKIASVRPYTEEAIRYTEKLLNSIDWDKSARSATREWSVYRDIIERIKSLYDGRDRTRCLIPSSLITVLKVAFGHILGITNPGEEERISENCRETLLYFDHHGHDQAKIDA